MLIARQPRAWVPDDTYSAICRHAEARRTLGQRQKVFLHYEIADGPYLGVMIDAILPLPKDGRISPASRFWRFWTRAAGRRPSRGDRMSLDVFRHRLVAIRTRTVTKGHDGKPLARDEQYSVADDLLTAAEVLAS